MCRAQLQQVSVAISSLFMSSFSLPPHAACRILVPPTRLQTPCPLHWDPGVLTTGVPLPSVSLFLPPLLHPHSCLCNLLDRWPLGVLGPERSWKWRTVSRVVLGLTPVRPWTSCVLCLECPHPQHPESQSRGGRTHPSPGGGWGANSWLVQNAGIQVLGRCHRSGH